MRKQLLVLLLGFALSITRAAGQDAPNPLDGTLVDCGKDKVAILENTASKDGRFAAAWTLRPKPGKPPVDWSAYDRTNPAAFVAGYREENSVDWSPDGAYQLVNGLVDFPAKTFVPLPGEDPFFPGEQHCHLAAVWSADRHGTRYAAVSNVVGTRREQTTVDLRLVIVGPGGLGFVDLKPAADKAVRGYMHRRDPKGYRRYEWSFDFNETPADGKPFTVFRADVLTIHFNADISGSDKDFDSGRVLFALPKGNVLRLNFDKK